MTIMSNLHHDESPALASDSTWLHEDQVRDEQITSWSPPPVDPNGPLPVVVYFATDFRPGPLDNAQIGLKSFLQSAGRAGGAVVRWTPASNPLDGKVEMVNPLDEREAPRRVDLDYVRNWPTGVIILASWPGNDSLVQAAEIVFTGPFGEPRVVLDGSNAELHMHDRIAGYRSGLSYAARRRPR